MHLAKVLGVILLILGGDLTGLDGSARVGPRLLDEGAVHVHATADWDSTVGQTTLMDFLLVEVRARKGGLEAEPIQKIDVGLGAMALVVLVGDDLDLVEAEALHQLRLYLEHSLLHDGLLECLVDELGMDLDGWIKMLKVIWSGLECCDTGDLGRRGMRQYWRGM